MNGQKKKAKRPNNDLQSNAHTTNDREAGNPTKIDATSDNFVNTTNGNICFFLNKVGFIIFNQNQRFPEHQKHPI